MSALLRIEQFGSFNQLNVMRFLLLLSISLATGLTVAQDWFEIEIIIFEHKNIRDNSQYNSEETERWPRNLNLAWPSLLLALEPAAERAESVNIPPPFEELIFDQRRMNNDSYALRVRDPYKLLWHKAWKAPQLPEEQAPWILVQAGEELGDHHRLEGAIRIHLSRYLHLSTNLWLTEISGNAIVENTIENVILEDGFIDTTEDVSRVSPEEHSLNSVIQEVEVRSEFDWSQLPEPVPVRWGCNYVRELWPEDNHLLPADYDDDPAPADWYYPFGCRTPSDLIEKDIPHFVNIPTSDRYDEAELERYYPELFTEPKLVDSTVLENTALKTDSKVLSINTQTLLEDVEVVFFNEDGSFDNVGTELIPPVPRLRYPVKEIIHIEGKRRMRSREFHYIDHPKIGVLAIIHPVEKPDFVLAPETVGQTEPAEQSGNQ